MLSILLSICTINILRLIITWSKNVFHMVIWFLTISSANVSAKSFLATQFLFLKFDLSVYQLLRIERVHYRILMLYFHILYVF